MISELKFEHGKKTCAVEPGKFCRFERVSGFGTRFECSLHEAELFFEDGWLQRCPQCIEKFGGEQ